MLIKRFLPKCYQIPGLLALQLKWKRPMSYQIAISEFFITKEKNTCVHVRSLSVHVYLSEEKRHNLICDD